MKLEFVAGTSLAESYYQEMGHVYYGLSFFVAAMGIFCGSSLVWKGLE